MARTETRTVTRDGVSLAVDVGGAGPLVILAHGFPELGCSWRHQVPALINAGYRVAVPDMRGYGRSDRPGAIEAYDIEQLTGDLAAIADDLGEERAVFVGHDWGSIAVWQMALLQPERVKGVVGMSVPFLPRGPMSTLELLRQLFAERFFYMVYFQNPGVADAELASDTARTMRRLLAGPTPNEFSDEERAALGAKGDAGFIDRLPEPRHGLPPWLSQDDLDHYVAEFERTGFTGGLNWYRNLDRNWRLTEGVAEAHVTCPSLFITGSLDPVAGFAPVEPGLAFLDDHRGNVVVEGAGHWVQQESPADVNGALLVFLEDVHGRS
ncbi:MAG: alpha/beta fold hydrolase [Acidimicrobiales bacterium]